jgi:hypothetical protein
MTEDVFFVSDTIKYLGAFGMCMSETSKEKMGRRLQNTEYKMAELYKRRTLSERDIYILSNISF